MPCPRSSEQIDKDAATQEPVDFVLTRTVAPHETTHGGLLVGSVVVDMKVGVGFQTQHDEIDERLERLALRIESDLTTPLDGPKGMKRRLTL